MQLPKLVSLMLVLLCLLCICASCKDTEVRSSTKPSKQDPLNDTPYFRLEHSMTRLLLNYNEIPMQYDTKTTKYSEFEMITQLFSYAAYNKDTKQFEITTDAGFIAQDQGSALVFLEYITKAGGTYNNELLEADHRISSWTLDDVSYQMESYFDGSTVVDVSFFMNGVALDLTYRQNDQYPYMITMPVKDFAVLINATYDINPSIAAIHFYSK